VSITPYKKKSGGQITLFFQSFSQQLRCLAGVTVDGGVGDDNAFAFHSVGRPDVIQVQIVA
jgi:hypothetical protein